MMLFGRTSIFNHIETYMHAHEQTAISMALQLQKILKRFADDAYSLLKHMYLENVFHHITGFQNIKFTLEGKKIMEN